MAQYRFLQAIRMRIEKPFFPCDPLALDTPMSGAQNRVFVGVSAMARNILIFADGTGNEGGLIPDESRTNVYKLYRATRTGSDSNIDPSRQIAFYIRGVGTPTANGVGFWLRIWEVFQQTIGAGLTSRIVDCYAAIISVWQPGDRIYLFGFSRGAYTARCVAHVLELVGIPTKASGGPSASNPPRFAELRRLG